MKTTAFVLVIVTALTMPLAFVGCPESEASDGSTPWPNLYVGHRYVFYDSRPPSVISASELLMTVEGYKGNWVYGREGHKEIQINMQNVYVYTSY